MATQRDAIAAQLLASIEASEGHPKPYRHWFLSNCLPTAVADEITALPFPPPALDGVSGKRELHTVFKDGKILRTTDFKSIRARANEGL